jgi:hypothetical protein
MDDATVSGRIESAPHRHGDFGRNGTSQAQKNDLKLG